MTSPTRYVKGDWKSVCDSCGQRFLASELRKRWDGLMVCSKDYEPRHPQDFVRAKTDIQAVPWTRPETIDYQFESIGYGKQFYEHVRSDLETVLLSVGYNRSFSETTSYLESIIVSLGLARSFSDSTTNAEGLSFSCTKNLTESVPTADSGGLVMQDYVDITYFASDYVGVGASF